MKNCNVTSFQINNYEFGLVISCGKIKSIRFTRDPDCLNPDSTFDLKKSVPLALDIYKSLRLFFAGKEMFSFEKSKLDLEQFPETRKKIYERLLDVPPGQTISYGKISSDLSLGRLGARIVGSAMASNPIPILIPCHRVILKDGSIGNYSGAGGVATKKDLIELERKIINLNNYAG